MTLKKEKVSLLQLDLDNEKSEYELDAIKLTMDGYRDEANYDNTIISVYKQMSDLLDKSFDYDYDTFLINLEKEYKEIRSNYMVTFKGLDEPADSFIAGLKIEALDKLYFEVLNKLEV